MLPSQNELSLSKGDKGQSHLKNGVMNNMFPYSNKQSVSLVSEYT